VQRNKSRARSARGSPGCFVAGFSSERSSLARSLRGACRSEPRTEGIDAYDTPLDSIDVRRCEAKRAPALSSSAWSGQQQPASSQARRVIAESGSDSAAPQRAWLHYSHRATSRWREREPKARESERPASATRRSRPLHTPTPTPGDTACTIACPTMKRVRPRAQTFAGVCGFSRPSPTRNSSLLWLRRPTPSCTARS
jgi:hypothetical protein